MYAIQWRVSEWLGRYLNASKKKVQDLENSSENNDNVVKFLEKSVESKENTIKKQLEALNGLEKKQEKLCCFYGQHALNKTRITTYCLASHWRTSLFV